MIYDNTKPPKSINSEIVVLFERAVRHEQEIARLWRAVGGLGIANILLSLALFIHLW